MKIEIYTPLYYVELELKDRFVLLIQIGIIVLSLGAVTLLIIIISF